MNLKVYPSFFAFVNSLLYSRSNAIISVVVKKKTAIHFQTPRKKKPRLTMQSESRRLKRSLAFNDVFDNVMGVNSMMWALARYWHFWQTVASCVTNGALKWGYDSVPSCVYRYGCTAVIRPGRVSKNRLRLILVVAAIAMATCVAGK